MKTAFLILALTLAPFAAGAEPQPVEIHTRLASTIAADKKVALTLDACSGKYDDDLIDFLIRNRIPATIFATKKWLDRNPHGLSVIKAHLDLFDVENHGEKHIPAIIGTDRNVYGIPGEPDVIHLRREVVEGARAVEKATGIAPHWYRDATGEYDPQAIQEIDKLGYKIAGFSVNADQGATAKKAAIEKRLEKVMPGDVIIAHMNKPASDSAEGLAVGLAYLLKAGFVFVRLDQVDLQVIPAKAAKKSP
ncbi:polysaccharide deacetylase [mine drainage metagenome]|uniref:Polysaccharide deacetylase n=1 Tax=mine drainage metagenome TaxID=410659 RepID=A0A1J5T7P7_9ZZZZ